MELLAGRLDWWSLPVCQLRRILHSDDFIARTNIKVMLDLKKLFFCTEVHSYLLCRYRALIHPCPQPVRVCWWEASSLSCGAASTCSAAVSPPRATTKISGPGTQLLCCLQGELRFLLDTLRSPLSGWLALNDWGREQEANTIKINTIKVDLNLPTSVNFLRVRTSCCTSRCYMLE